MFTILSHFSKTQISLSCFNSILQNYPLINCSLFPIKLLHFTLFWHYFVSSSHFLRSNVRTVWRSVYFSFKLYFGLMIFIFSLISKIRNLHPLPITQRSFKLAQKRFYTTCRFRETNIQAYRVRFLYTALQKPTSNVLLSIQNETLKLSFKT